MKADLNTKKRNSNPPNFTKNIRPPPPYNTDSTFMSIDTLHQTPDRLDSSAKIVCEAFSEIDIVTRLRSNIDMMVPPTEGLLDYGGRLSSYARVIRIDRTHSLATTQSDSLTRAVALEFCESPKLLM